LIHVFSGPQIEPLDTRLKKLGISIFTSTCSLHTAFSLPLEVQVGLKTEQKQKPAIKKIRRLSEPLEATSTVTFKQTYAYNFVNYFFELLYTEPLSPLFNVKEISFTGEMLEVYFQAMLYKPKSPETIDLIVKVLYNEANEKEKAELKKTLDEIRIPQGFGAIENVVIPILLNEGKSLSVPPRRFTYHGKSADYELKLKQLFSIPIKS